MIRFDEYLLITNFVVTKMIDYYGNMNKPTALELRLDQELDQLLIDLYKDEEPITVSSTDRALSEDEEKIWRQILLDEDEGDADPNKSNVDKKASSSTTKISEKPLALRNKVGKPSFTVAVETPSSELEENLSDFEKRIIKRVQEAQAYEVKIFNDINTEAFRATKFDAVIDWLDIKFTVDPKKCDFCFKPKARSFIKAFITRQTGIRHYVADKSEVIQDGASFTIRLHDVNNRKELGRIVKILTKQYGCKVEEMTIEAIELSFDLYNAQNSALLIALHKSLKYPKVVNHMRIYKTKGTAKAVPDSPHELYALLEDGYNLIIALKSFVHECTSSALIRMEHLYL